MFEWFIGWVVYMCHWIVDWLHDCMANLIFDQMDVCMIVWLDNWLFFFRYQFGVFDWLNGGLNTLSNWWLDDRWLNDWMNGYERASATSERSLFNITGKSQYERPDPARPETLLIGNWESQIYSLTSDVTVTSFQIGSAPNLDTTSVRYSERRVEIFASLSLRVAEVKGDNFMPPPKRLAGGAEAQRLPG